MPDKTSDTIIAAVMEQLVAEGPQAMAQVMTALMNLAMRIEREQFLGEGPYERVAERRGYANGTKPKLIETLAGTLSLEVPKTVGTGERYYPQALERGRRSCRAVMLAVVEMFVCGVSTRDAERVMAEFGLKSLSSTEASRATKLLDDRCCRALASDQDHHLRAATTGRPAQGTGAELRGRNRPQRKLLSRRSSGPNFQQFWDLTQSAQPNIIGDPFRRENISHCFARWNTNEWSIGELTFFT
jgi:hypothetical protein